MRGRERACTVAMGCHGGRWDAGGGSGIAGTPAGGAAAATGEAAALGASLEWGYAVGEDGCSGGCVCRAGPGGVDCEAPLSGPGDSCSPTAAATAARKLKGSAAQVSLSLSHTHSLYVEI